MEFKATIKELKQEFSTGVFFDPQSGHLAMYGGSLLLRLVGVLLAGVSRGQGSC